MSTEDGMFRALTQIAYAELTPSAMREKAREAIRRVHAHDSLRDALLAAYRVLDPQLQGPTDPITFDGRPLAEQARDVCALLDAREPNTELSEYLWTAAQKCPG